MKTYIANVFLPGCLGPVKREVLIPDEISVENAARTLSDAFDYPWEHMPEQGRENMRKHAKAVIEAAFE